ncbi:AmmeMemoRadiSam system protein A [Thermanaerosceptrum fracticalcis]|uniref:AmmeMemoRadiSam system protein A n=1 Tax=Thermanaerosceptrum fracticalcis TaxID=1712410 RepID=A0A7G6E5Y1_THEFR|nr:AmmeMemoRadiSam system protein A [Thermanaerosceptrum fracticalcis]QNB47485.1 AmmeMemoRadiSam system protein A [Thermanaerosceptrum fracticalcis]
MLEIITYLPHPPIVVPEVGGKEGEKVAATARAMERLARLIKVTNPQVLVAVTPHGHVFSDAVTITALDTLEGDLSQFGAPRVKVKYDLDLAGAQSIVEQCRIEDIPCALLDKDVLSSYRLSPKMDHGLVVPFSFIEKAGWQGKIIPVNMGLLPYEELYHFGKILRDVLNGLERKWVLLISGDLSHRLTLNAPAGYSPRGAVFDEIIRQCVREADIKRVFSLSQDLIEEAGECGLRPLVMGLGAMDGYEVKAEELSYEAPFGVGYLVAKFELGTLNKERELVDELINERKTKIARIHDKESPPVKLARASIMHYLKEGKYLKMPEEFKHLLEEKAGAFVSLKKHGQLRGCIGTIEAVQPNLGQEIIHNAVSAALHDPRFEPVILTEMDEITISVDVLGHPEKITGMKELDPKKYGVIVSSGRKRGLLLPDLPGVDTVEEQVRIAREKAGIRPDEPISLERFMVTRYY